MNTVGGETLFQGNWGTGSPGLSGARSPLDAPGFAPPVIIQPSMAISSAGLSSGRKKSGQVLTS